MSAWVSTKTINMMINAVFTSLAMATCNTKIHYVIVWWGCVWSWNLCNANVSLYFVIDAQYNTSASDEHDLMCSSDSRVCMSGCEYGVDGWFMSCDDCRTYMQCSNGRATHHSCPQKALWGFNADTRECQYQSPHCFLCDGTLCIIWLTRGGPWQHGLMCGCNLFFCLVIHPIFSHLRAHAFARSVAVARSSAVQVSSSRRQERWTIVGGSPQSQFTDWASSRLPHLLITVFAWPTPVRIQLRARQKNQSSPDPAGKDSSTSSGY